MSSRLYIDTLLAALGDSALAAFFETRPMHQSVVYGDGCFERRVGRDVRARRLQSNKAKLGLTRTLVIVSLDQRI
jgi:hypothetical protein